MDYKDFLNQGRKFLGMELKESYYKQAVLNLKKVESDKENSFL